MSKKDIEDIVNREVTNDLQTKKFLDEIGWKARVERETVPTDELTTQLREVLEAIGEDFKNVGEKVPKGMEYMGSAAVHIYKMPITGMVAYYSQLAIGRCPEAIAGPAATDLKNAMLENYGHKRQKLRSGF